MDQTALTETPAPIRATETPIPVSSRLRSLDAYRGLVMFLMMAEVLSFCRVAAAKAGNGFWEFLCHHQSHVEWIGCSLHDLIQPSFSFLVGVALPFSIASRLARGQTKARMTWHALWRAAVLILLGVFLRSIGRGQTNWTFEDTLTQIGLGYPLLFWLGLRPVRYQWVALGCILVGYWAAFAWYPLPGPDFDYTEVGVPQNWPHLMSGFQAHWNKNSNFAWSFDTWFLNLFPRQNPFVYNGGGYCTTSFIPTLGTMVLGLIAGGVIRSERSAGEKLKWLAVAGVVSLIVGWLLGVLGVCPVVKRIWTPSWTIFSGGWCFVLMAAFYFLLDMRSKWKWSFPLVVIGMNSIAAYCIAHLFDGFIFGTFKTHLGANVFKLFGNAYERLVQGGAVLLVYWLILFWMYRRKIFLRI